MNWKKEDIRVGTIFLDKGEKFCKVTEIFEQKHEFDFKIKFLGAPFNELRTYYSVLENNKILKIKDNKLNRKLYPNYKEKNGYLYEI